MRTERLITFHNVRARLLPTGETAWRGGWTRHLHQSQARIRMKDAWEFPMGTPVLGECFGDGTMVRFNGVIAGQMGSEVAVRVVGSLSFERSTETIRIYVEGVSGRLVCGSQTKPVQVVDVSPESLGAILSEPLTVGSIFVLHLDTIVGEIGCTVSVLNCFKECAPMPAYRVGLRIFDISRLDTARWARLIEEASHAGG